MTIIFIFFFQRYGAHRDLHSFPTRRSSDLAELLHDRVREIAGRALDLVVPLRKGLRGSVAEEVLLVAARVDRKSTRLNSSHMSISYAVFCLKKKKKQTLMFIPIIYLYLEFF